MNFKKSQNDKKQEINQEKNNLLIIDYLSQIDSLKSYIQYLEYQIKELKYQIRELGLRNIALIEFEHENISLNDQKKELKQKIEDLEQDIISSIKKGKEETRDATLLLENEINYYKRITDAVKNKIAAAEHIIKLNSIQHNYILKLEQEIEDLKNNNLENIDRIKIEHDLHYNHLKKKMLDLIKKSNVEIQKENKTNIEIRSKFSAMNKIEILDELEKQNNQIMQLVKEKEIKDKQILNLTQEYQAYHSIDKILKKKNLKFSKLIDDFLEKQKNNDNNINNKNNINKIENTKDNLLLFKTTMTNKNFPNSPKFQKDYDDLLIKYNSLKEKYEYITDKERLIQKKYSAIINLYETALKDLLQDKTIDIKKINIDFNKLIEGNIDSYSKEEKIKIILLLMKHLLPLIKAQSNDLIKLRNLFSNIDIKFKINQGSNVYSHSRNQNSNILKSLYDIRQFTSDLNYSLKKEENLKSKNKSIFNTYNNTYNNMNYNNIKNLMNSKEESKSIKSSFFGLNINNASAIKKKDEKKFNTRTNIDKNKFALTTFNFYKHNNNRDKNNSIKLFKKGMIREELMNKNPPLQRMMQFHNISSKTKCVTENNFSS